MAPTRYFAPGLSHHVYHRGNNRTVIFSDDRDRSVFLVLLGRAMQRGGIRVHSYALMTTHYHALVTAPDESALPLAMQRLGTGYVRYFNKRYSRTGTLWEGRYQASLILDERYWFNCMRYVEMNPVTASMVSSPEAYRWSSYGSTAFGRPDPLITLHPLYLALGRTEEERRAAWRNSCGQSLDDDEVALIETALRTSTPLHRPGFPFTPEDDSELSRTQAS